MANVFPWLRGGTGMSGFDLDLQTVEEHLDQTDAEETAGRRVVLGVLDGSTPAADWYDLVDGGNVLVLDVRGNVNELAAGFARDVKEDGGSLMRFRGFLVVTPPGVDIDPDRLRD